MPEASSSDASRGASVRPSLFVRTALISCRSPLDWSRRDSSTRMPAAGRPRAVSSTWVVRPAIRSGPPLHGTLDQAVGLGVCMKDLALVLHPEPLQVVRDVVPVGQGEVNLLYLRESLQHRPAHAVERVLHR